MATARRGGTIDQMLDPDQLVLCEHDREPGDCPICNWAEDDLPAFDPHAWVEAYAATSREPLEVPDELAGVPFG